MPSWFAPYLLTNSRIVKNINLKDFQTSNKNQRSKVIIDIQENREKQNDSKPGQLV